jgi:BioD-like phosphotransacetylase family protein
MTTSIYVTSTQAFSGKSALCVGLLRRFQQSGLQVGYMKPVSTSARVVGDRLMDEDTHFVKYTFGLTDKVETMAPVLLTDQQVASVLAGEEDDFAVKVQSAFQTIAQGKDVMVLEGGASLREGWIVNLAPPHVADLLGARELIVVPYANDLQLVDDLITARVRLGESLVGGVINSVPNRRMDFVETQVKPYVEGHGVPILAVLPKEQVLLSVSVTELREGLGGEILCSHNAVDELVEHLMVGAMNVDSAFSYFSRKANKAVITGGDRPDIILTGGLRPSPMILGRAEEAGVPIILTHHDTLTAVEIIETFFGRTRFHQEKKVKRFERLLNEHMDFEALYAALGMR